MVETTVQNFALASEKKLSFLNKNPLKYFLLSAFAGIFVGFGILLVFSIGAPLKIAGIPSLKLVMGASFGIALTLVIFAGSELFTGNNMIMTIGSLSKKVSWPNTLKLWLVCYAGNLFGSLFLAVLIKYAGLFSTEASSILLLAATKAKMTTPFTALLFKGILCNMLVCLAVWTSARTNDDSAKILLIFWCLFAFIGAGLEHSVANMTLLAMGIFANTGIAEITWTGYFNNLLPVTLGNIIGGGFFIGAIYWFIAQNKKD